MDLKLGKRPASYRADTLRWADVKVGVTLPVDVKPHGGYGGIFSTGPWPGWGMYGNGPCDDGSITDTSSYAYNGAGDCAWAGPGHETMELNKNAGRPVPKFTSANILDQYAQYLKLPNYQALNANNDQGSDVQDVLQIRQTTGLIDVTGTAHKIAAYVSIEPSNLADLWDALYLFETVGIGINFPESAMDQFNENKTWSVVPGAQIEGGHYIPLVGHPTANTWTAVTWGKRQTMTPQFISKYCDEAYAYITLDRYNTVTGETAQGYTDVDLEQYLSLVGTSPSS
jgi:hypothetical protein